MQKISNITNKLIVEKYDIIRFGVMIRMIIFCIIYYLFSYIQTIPQIIKLIKTKSSNDYSLGMITMQFIGVLAWTIYIITSLQTTIVYIGSIIDMVLLTLVDYLILKYYKFK